MHPNVDRSAQRGRRTNKARNRNTKKGQAGQTDTPGSELPKSTDADQEDATNVVSNVEGDGDESLCWICAEPVKYYSLSECNHRTCHVCALRLRALYKKTDCTFCKHPQDTVIFTTSPQDPFSDYVPARIPFKDARLSIAFESQEMMEETMIVLRFNCPDQDCDYIGSGWSDLKVHVRAMHGKSMCDLCIRLKKVFAHEHTLYSHNQLSQHLPTLSHRFGKTETKEKIEGGIHPMCEFCRECFFGDDELFSHMRERHEECFVCKRKGVVHQYFRNYDHLEQHFNHAHFPCTQGSCLAQKFVVFGSAIDLQAHMVEQHGAQMSSKDKKEIRRVVADFEFEEVGGSSTDRRRRHDGEREREPPPGPPSQPRTRREGFGATLTSNTTPTGGSVPSPSTTHQPGSRHQSPSPSRHIDPFTAQRHEAFTTRLNAATSNSPTATAAIKASIRSYRSSESGARDLITTFFNALDRDLEGTASLIILLVDLLEDEDKKKNLLASWNGFKIEQRREFPDLVPTSTGSEYAGVAGGRVLNVKHSTSSRSSQQPSWQVLDRVARAAGSSSSTSGSAPGPNARQSDRFPALKSSAAPAVPMYRQPTHTTAWASSSTVAAKPSVSVIPPRITPQTKDKSDAAPPSLSDSAFPTLPVSSSSRARPGVGGNQSLRNIVGNTTPPVAWGSGSRPLPETEAATDSVVEPLTGPDSATNGGKGKKKKGKEKQMLFTMGSFPT
ncbi:hypothetical protein BD410DRAFT_713852 [Rickenella mellea]|uniref:RING-type E3 ubiquitin transferase n=1 Tax=Rickenella mellea TaxID=50990 RepID=A0A4Y7QJ95_9AGAM|nr:hypothetical protein BD410DRAFT_713852 [Rickenella mellea]